MEQENLPGFDREVAIAEQSEVPEITRLTHLAKWGVRFEKYAQYSKDPEFRKRMMECRGKCFHMMNDRYHY